jgi:acyl-coenzyme A synthetase/AMP-(fatty) acid ligase
VVRIGIREHDTLITDIGDVVVNQLATFLTANGVACNDYIAVFTTNSPEMVITILALSKLGAIAALINTNLRGNHSPVYRYLVC